MGYEPVRIFIENEVLIFQKFTRCIYRKKAKLPSDWFLAEGCGLRKSRAVRLGLYRDCGS
jgi:hypothetical protein